MGLGKCRLFSNGWTNPIWWYFFWHLDISELLDMAKPHCLDSFLKLEFLVTGIFDYLRQWLMLFKFCHLAPLCWETAKFEIIRYIFDRFGTRTKVWSQSCKTHISSKMRNTNLKQKTEMFKQFSFKEKDKSIQWWLNSVKLKAGCQTNLRIFIWDRH